MISSRFKTLLEGFNCNDPLATQTPVFYGVGKPGLLAPDAEKPYKIRDFFELLVLDLPLPPFVELIYTFSPESEVMYIAFPAILGVVKSIYDPNGFLITADWEMSKAGLICSDSTDNYNAYEFKNLTTQVNTEITFKFSSNLTHI